jgi:hypothetical protein
MNPQVRQKKLLSPPIGAVIKTTLPYAPIKNKIKRHWTMPIPVKLIHAFNLK